MKLLTPELEQMIPLLYDTEDTPLDNKMVYVKFFTPDANWTWYVTEYDPTECQATFKNHHLRQIKMTSWVII